MTTKKPHYTEKNKPDLEAVLSLAENIAQTMQIRINWQKLNLKIRGFFKNSGTCPQTCTRCTKGDKTLPELHILDTVKALRVDNLHLI